MALLRAGMSVTDACMEVGCTSLGSFSSRFTEVVGVTPSAYRAREHDAVLAMPACVAKVQTRPIRDPSVRDSPVKELSVKASSIKDQSIRNEEAGGGGAV